MSEISEAAARRADYVRALREERDGYTRIGQEGRAAVVDAEIARVEARPVGRTETPTEPAPKPARKRTTRG